MVIKMGPKRSIHVKENLVASIMVIKRMKASRCYTRDDIDRLERLLHKIRRAMWRGDNKE